MEIRRTTYPVRLEKHGHSYLFELRMRRNRMVYTLPVILHRWTDDTSVCITDRYGIRSVKLYNSPEPVITLHITHNADVTPEIMRVSRYIDGAGFEPVKNWTEV